MRKKIPVPSADTVLVVDAADYAVVNAHRWCINATGYMVAHIDGRVIYLPRLLLDIPAGVVVVHRNGNGLDFRRTNLCMGTRSEAMQHQKKRAGSSGQHKRVQRHKRSGCWRALLWRVELQRNLHLGYFDSEIEVAKAYDAAARQLYGEDAWGNFP